MRRITLWALSTLSAVVLLFGYSTSTSGPTTTATSSFVSGSTAGEPLVATTPAATPAATPAPTTDTGTDTAGSAGSAAAPTTTSTATLTGEVAQTRWGPVQVELTVTDGQITDVAVLQYPQGNGRDVEINDQALPILIDETKQAQSADIDVVSGATVTSDGYLQSLQSALDQA